VKLGLGGIADCTLMPNDDVTRIAHEAWTEPATRMTTFYLFCADAEVPGLARLDWVSPARA